METNHVIDGIQQAAWASSDNQAPQTQLNERYRRPIRNMEQKPIAELTGMEEARAGAGSSRPFLTQVGHSWASGGIQTCTALTGCSQVGHMEATTWVGWRRGGWDTSRKQKCTGPGNALSMNPSFFPLPQGRMLYQGVNKKTGASPPSWRYKGSHPSESKMKPGQGRGPSRKSGSEEVKGR